MLAALIGKDHPGYKKRQHRWAKRLLKDKVQNLIDETLKECTGRPEQPEMEKALGYFVRNVARMQCGTFRAKGYFMGSGVVEAAAKPSSAAAASNPGCFGPNRAPRISWPCAASNSSNRLDEFWRHRLNQKAARNDSLALTA